MTYRLAWSTFARDRLAENLDFLAAADPARAHAVLDRILSRLDSLVDHPWSAPPWQTLQDPTFRRLVVDEYIVIYRVVEAEQAVYVLSVRHGRQRPPDPGELG